MISSSRRSTARVRVGKLGAAPAAHVLGDEKWSPLHLADPMDRDDVGVLQARHCARLDEEAIALALIGLARCDHLDRDGPVEEEVVGKEDLTHSAASERA